MQAVFGLVWACDQVRCNRTAHRPHPQNALFAGSDGGGEHWAIIAYADRDLQAQWRRAPHLTDVITKIVNRHSNSQIDNLLPWAYAQTFRLKSVA